MHPTFTQPTHTHTHTHDDHSTLHAERDHLLILLRVNGCYFWFTILQIAMTITILLLLYVGWMEIISGLEAVLAFMVALDLLIRYFSEGGTVFLRSLDNRVNIFVLILLIGSIVTDIVMETAGHHDEEVFAGIFLVLRYLIQFGRLIKLIMDSRCALDTVKNANVDLSITENSIQEDAV